MFNISSALQLAESIDPNRVLLYLIRRMEPLRCVPFVLIYGCHTLGESFYPDTAFMQGIFDLFSYRLVFVIHVLKCTDASLITTINVIISQIQGEPDEVLHHARLVHLPHVLLDDPSPRDYHVGFALFVVFA